MTTSTGNRSRELSHRGKHTVLPPSDLEEMLDLSHFLDQLRGPAALLGPDGETVDIPVEAFTVLRSVVDAMRTGKAINVTLIDQMLTTQEAADFLGISRPTFVKILEREEIPFEYTSGGRHRRVRLQDVMDYQSRKRVERRKTLDALVEQASEYGLYEDDPRDYAAIMKEVRAEIQAEQK